MASMQLPNQYLGIISHGRNRISSFSRATVSKCISNITLQLLFLIVISGLLVDIRSVRAQTNVAEQPNFYGSTSKCFAVQTESENLLEFGSQNYCTLSAGVKGWPRYFRTCARSYEEAATTVASSALSRRNMLFAKCQDNASFRCSQAGADVSVATAVPSSTDCCGLPTQCLDDTDCNERPAVCCSDCRESMEGLGCDGAVILCSQLPRFTGCDLSDDCGKDTRKSSKVDGSVQAVYVLFPILLCLMSIFCLKKFFFDKSDEVPWEPQPFDFSVPRNRLVSVQILSRIHFQLLWAKEQLVWAGTQLHRKHPLTIFSLLLVPTWLWTVFTFSVSLHVGSGCFLSRMAKAHGPFQAGSPTYVCSCQFGAPGICDWILFDDALGMVLALPLVAISMWKMLSRNKWGGTFPFLKVTPAGRWFEVTTKQKQFSMHFASVVILGISFFSAITTLFVQIISLSDSGKISSCPFEAVLAKLCHGAQASIFMQGIKTGLLFFTFLSFSIGYRKVQPQLQVSEANSNSHGQNSTNPHAGRHNRMSVGKGKGKTAAIWEGHETVIPRSMVARVSKRDHSWFQDSIAFWCTVLAIMFQLVLFFTSILFGEQCGAEALSEQSSICVCNFSAESKNRGSCAFGISMVTFGMFVVSPVVYFKAKKVLIHDMASNPEDHQFISSSMYLSGFASVSHLIVFLVWVLGANTNSMAKFNCPVGSWSSCTGAKTALAFAFLAFVAWGAVFWNFLRRYAKLWKKFQSRLVQVKPRVKKVQPDSSAAPSPPQIVALPPSNEPSANNDGLEIPVREAAQLNTQDPRTNAGRSRHAVVIESESESSSEDEDGLHFAARLDQRKRQDPGVHANKYKS